jgi:UPF0755 protein
VLKFRWLYAWLLAPIVVVVFVGWFLLNAFPLGGAGAETIVQVQQGQSLSSIGSTLQHDGVISSSLAFRLDTLIFGAPIVRPGSYEIRRGSSFSTIRSILGQSPNVQTVDVLAGLTVHEVALLLASDEGNTFANTFVKDASIDAGSNPFHPNGSLEGLLGTGLYVIKLNETPQQLLETMQARFENQASQTGITPTTTLHGLSAYQLVIAASIVEKEGYYPKNMGKVARVILNRLRRGGDLQMDATVLYYLNDDGGKVTPSMLRTPTPYNTYLNPGLTPTPICQVSQVALRAVVSPPAGSWLYFTVIDKSGTEAFSNTFAEQLANERLAAERGVA